MTNRYFKSKVQRVEFCIFRWLLLRFCERLTGGEPTTKASRLVDCALILVDEMEEVLHG